MDDEDQGVTDVRTGRAMWVAGDPICDHIYKTTANDSWSAQWLYCIHCEAHIRIVENDPWHSLGGAS